MSYCENNYYFEKFITFSDNCISEGGLYENNGFTLDKHIPADYMYLVKHYKREHKFKYRKVKFKNDPSLQYDENMTERQLASLNGMLRIYDAGKIKWVKEVR